MPTVAPPIGTDTSTYAQRGVSSSKGEVHAAIKDLNPGLFPGAFCKIMPSDHPRYCEIMHCDSAGTKTSLAFLLWQVTKGECDFGLRGTPVDALVMNVDDVICVGATGNFMVNQFIARNKFLINGEAVKILIRSADEFCKMLTEQGVKCQFAGGETADVPDNVRGFEVSSSLHVRMKRADVIDASRICPGNILVGLSATGKAKWEKRENSSIGANGLTDARHDMLADLYKIYTETYAPQVPEELVYRGNYQLDDTLPDTNMLVLEALLSPTRTYAPLLRTIIKYLGPKKINGIIHCTGGGQTKIGKFGQEGNRYVINKPFDVPPIFRTIRKVSNKMWWDMFKVYNMGWRMVLALSDMQAAKQCIFLSEQAGIEAKIIGHVARQTKKHPGKVEIMSPDGEVLVY